LCLIGSGTAPLANTFPAVHPHAPGGMFATGEILEQKAIAESLTSSADPKPAKLTAAQQADLEKVQNASAADFDQTYLTVQIALIARAFIINHLYILKHIKNETL
jgi:hypothetical protein